MKLGLFVGGICIAISLGLIYLEKDFQITDPYFKGSILGLGIGLLIGNVYGYLVARIALKKLYLKERKENSNKNSYEFEIDENKEDPI
jgi:hypothetical protein